MRSTMRWIAPFVLAVSLILTPSPGLRAQGKTENPEARLPRSSLSGEEGASLTAWARGYLENLGGPDGAGEQSLPTRFHRVRAMYFLSVEDGDWVATAKDSISALEDFLPEASAEAMLVPAYRGALEVVRAKHSRWPPNKLKYLNRGAELLDGIVDQDPENLEARYLRLASYIFLPFFLERGDAVQEDLGILAERLPSGAEAFPPPLYEAVVGFVLEHGDLENEFVARLEQALEDRGMNTKRADGPPAGDRGGIR